MRWSMLHKSKRDAGRVLTRNASGERLGRWVTSSQGKTIVIRECYQARCAERRAHVLEQDWEDPAYVYNEEHHLFRLRDSRFAFSRELAEWGS